MRTNKLEVVAALVIGGLLACGSLVSAQTTNNAPGTQGKRPHFSVNQQVNRLSTQLSLTDDQKPQVKAVLENRQKQMHDLHADTSLTPQDKRSKMRSITEEENTKMKAILTADQYEKYQQITKRARGHKKASQSTNAPASNQ